MNIERVIASMMIGVSIAASAPSAADQLEIAQFPLFQSANYPPMNMMVMGRDHSLFYEAYNDSSDLTGNGVPDIGYKPDEIDYFGYFDSYKCYSYSGDLFSPSGETNDKTCSSGWSGDFLNWVTTSRIDALRKVLYGGLRDVDEEDQTILQRSYIPQDAHSWGKEYQSVERDGYDISDYTPLSQPGPGRYHLFANTSLTSDSDRPLMRVLRNTGFRVWEWVAIERPVAGNRCEDGANGPFCTSDASGRDDYVVRVEVCSDDSSWEENCKSYPSGSNKPTGLLQDFGEDGQMHFGLITGSYLNNMSGGVLRKRMESIASEIVLETGQFSDVDGIIRTIDTLAVTGLRSGHDYHPGWSGAWLTTRSMNEGEFPDWGNPIAEMLYESLRYYAGKAEPTADMVPDLTDGKERVPFRLGGNLEFPVSEWDDPYEDRPWCTMGANLVISNVNISHDGDLVPGSSFSSFSGDLSGFNASQLGQEIWDLEHGGSSEHFIGQSGGQSDGAPTVKAVSSLGNIRGLSPAEPTKEGTYYTASAARFGIKDDLRPDLESEQMIETFSVALASQLPKIEFPVGDQLISLVPFGKSVNGCIGTSPDRDDFQPMAQIVDFFIEEWANTHESNEDGDVNGGRPYASFRINFEDVEQAADHDMDGIVRYEVRVTEEDTLAVSLTPEYYAGCIKMNLGYVISGVESDFLHPQFPNETIREAADGLYLEVRGDPTAGENMAYYLNTPPGLPPGACAAETIEPQYAAFCNTAPGLPPESMGQAVTREFYPSGTEAATVLRDPLWYAAKYGNSNNTDLEPGETPENYFLVTNAATLKNQLAQAFQQILDLNAVTTLQTNSTRLQTDTLLYQASFETEAWGGEVIALDPETLDIEWRATDALPSDESSRNIWTWNSESLVGSTQGLEFHEDNADYFGDIIFPAEPDSSDLASALVAYVRGDRNLEEQNGGPFRTRDSLIGAIVNSQLNLSGTRNEGWARLPEDEGGGVDDPGTYGYFLDNVKSDRTDVLFVGANAGMLHAFDAESGEELFGYVPHTVLENLPDLARPEFTSRYFVDGQIAVSDARIGGQWRTVLVATLGAGGRAVFALDVTDPENFGANNVLWEFTSDPVTGRGHPDLGHPYGSPSITRLADGRWVAIFGNGYNGASNEPVLFVVDLATGEPIHSLTAPIPNNQKPDVNGLASPSILMEVNQRAHVWRAYAGDLSGRIWRFDFADNGAPAIPDIGQGNSNWLFETEDNRPVTSTPTLALSISGGVNVFFGTGKLIENDDRTSSDAESFYVVRDANEQVSLNELGERSLVQEEGGFRSISRDSDGSKGWQLELELNGNGGERVLARPSVTFGTLVFSTFEPDSGECSLGGWQRIYVLDAVSGEGDLTLPSCPGCGGIEIGSGAPINPPVVIVPPDPPDPGDGSDPGPGPGLPTDPDDPEDPEIPMPPDEASGDRSEWCSEFGFINPATSQFQPFGTLCDGRQVWRQAR